MAGGRRARVRQADIKLRFFVPNINIALDLVNYLSISQGCGFFETQWFNVFGIWVIGAALLAVIARFDCSSRVH